MEYNRFREALSIQEGACNVRGIARALVQAADAAEGPASQDAAVRLIVHQLYHLCNGWQIDNSLDEYGKLTKLCCEGAVK